MFTGNKEIIKNKLLEIGDVRNSLAHFRPVKKDDIELIKQNSMHTLAGVEQFLTGLFNQTDRVPTNTTDNWYVSLSTIGSDEISIIPMYSSDENWINLQISFRSAVIEKTAYSDGFFSYKLTRLKSPGLLENYPDLRKYIIYISEQLMYPSINEDYDIKVTKRLNMVFSKLLLKTNFQVIGDQLKTLVSTISDEGALLANDNLARGTLVDGVDATAFARQRDGQDGVRWRFSYSDLSCPYQSLHPEEYWGDLLFFGSDVVAGANRYPWMPSDISETEVPF